MAFDNLIIKIMKAEKAAGRIDLSFIDDEKMRELNREFRGKDKPTDVLSFQYDRGEIKGDVIISTDTSRRDAKRFGLTYREEIKRLVIHGVLHVLGYDHGRKMTNAEKIYSQF